MRLFIRNNILEFLSTLSEGFHYIEGTEPNDTSVIVDDCFAGLNVIEKTLEGSLSELRYNDYESILAEINKTLNKMASLNCCNRKTALSHRLDKLIKAIADKLFYEEEVKLEVLFLPYKYSMFDSLESIWAAASSDPECECFLMPIPYYDKDKNGDLAVFNYEGDSFPKNMPITNFNDYDISVRNPDIIFIHNPYDNYNNLTSVAPEYYSYNLKQHSNMLVYVPYFVTTDFLADSPIFTTGMQYSDKVIVQSEAIKKYYLNFLNDNKFLALGSPKIDKVVSACINDFVIPDEWINIINNRRVVLYNTHLHNIFNHPERLLKKLKFVFECFSKRYDMVLLWRPHPLSISTFERTWPNLVSQYLDIVKEFCCKKIGVYDDSADFHRAIALSDAYLGDVSSLVPIYGVTGKPVMIQNVELVKTDSVEDKIALMFQDCVIIDGYIWFSSFHSNGLYKADINTGKAEYVCSFPSSINRIHLAGNLHWGIQHYDDKLIFSPLHADGIDVYDITKGTLKRYSLKDLPLLDVFRGKFGFSASYKNYIFFIPRAYPAIVRFDVLTGELLYINDWLDQVEELSLSVGVPAYFGVSFCTVGSVLYLISSRKYAAYKFDMETCQGEYINFGDKQRLCSGICFDGASFWLSTLNMNYKKNNFWLKTSTSGPLLKWDGSSTDVEEYFLDTDDCIADNIFYDGGFVWFNVAGRRGLFRFNCKTKDFIFVEAIGTRPYGQCYSLITTLELICRAKHEDYFLLMFRYDSMIYKLKDGTIEALCTVNIDDKDFLQNLSTNFLLGINKENPTYHDFLMYESNNMDIPSMLSEIGFNLNKGEEQVKAFSQLFSNADGSSGSKIHNHIKQIVKKQL